MKRRNRKKRKSKEAAFLLKEVGNALSNKGDQNRRYKQITNVLKEKNMLTRENIALKKKKIKYKKRDTKNIESAVSRGGNVS